MWRRYLRLPALLLTTLLSVPLGAVAAAGATDWAIRCFCRLACLSVGLRVQCRGEIPHAGCLLVSNHVGYLDILALGCCLPARFLAKDEIAHWPLLGWLARRGGTVFVNRESPRDSRPMVGRIAQELREGRFVVLFPEGQVSADGRTLRRFRPMLFEACIVSRLPVLPVGIRYRTPAEPAVWAWIDEPHLWRHLWTRVLPQRRIEVEVRFGPPLHPEADSDRKALAERARQAVRELLHRGDESTRPGGESRKTGHAPS